MALGGRAAEAKIFRRVTTGKMSDTVISNRIPCLQSLYSMGERNFYRSPRRFPIFLRPIRKQPDHSMFLSNSSRARDGRLSVGRLVC